MEIFVLTKEVAGPGELVRGVFATAEDAERHVPQKAECAETYHILSAEVGLCGGTRVAKTIKVPEA